MSTAKELKAAIERLVNVASVTSENPDDEAAVALVRAHLETIDEERALIEECKRHCAALLKFNPGYDSVLLTRYRALVAKREQR